METAAQEAMVGLQAGFGALWALVLAYALSVIGAVILIAVGYFIANVIQRAVYAGLGRLPGFDRTLRQFFANIARYAVLMLVLVMVLGQFGVQTASIIAAIGAIGLAIGLALQGTLQNIAAGIMLLVLRPFRVGESIEVGSVAGEVEDIGLFATRLKAADGTYILAPNSKLWNEPIRNGSRNPSKRTDLEIGIGYDDDIDRAQALLGALAAGDHRVRASPEPLVFVSALGDSAVTLTLRYWTATADAFRCKLDLVKRAKLAFDANGISMPFPQREVVLREAPPPAGSDDRQRLDA